MNKLFYLKLAFTNIIKNKQVYVPFLWSCTLTIASFYIIYSLADNDSLSTIIGFDSIRMILVLGVFIVGLFAKIFLLYTNGFLIKSRKKEFGLFNILGMSKKHIALVVIYEILIIAFMSLLVGFLIGISLDKFLFMVISKMLYASIHIGFYVSSTAIKVSLVWFGYIFLLMYLNAVLQIKLTNPITLLQSVEQGEKEPKGKKLMAILGIVCLLIGYIISLKITNPIVAIKLFFVAVIFVIIGTYLLFTAGSIVLLKKLKNNKKYFYKPSHFINVSSMIYRMKKNAIGLANICILSTMVLVMISTSFCFWVSVKNSIMQIYSREIGILTDQDETVIQKVQDTAKQLLNEKDLKSKSILNYRYVSFQSYQENQFIYPYFEEGKLENSYRDIRVMSLDDYNRVMHTNYILNDNEILIYTNSTDFEYDELKVFDYQFSIKQRLQKFINIGKAFGYFIVVKDVSILEDINNTIKMYNNNSNLYYYYGFDIDATDQLVKSYYYSLQDKLDNIKAGYYRIDCRIINYQEKMTDYSALLFISIFLSLLFLMATSLIIYYKQMTEGYEDKERFEIMQKVGMDYMLVKKSISAQVLIIFFLPLVIAVTHLIFALPIISKMLRAFVLLDTQLLIYCVIGCIGLFVFIYGLIYMITAKLYYHIVKRD